MFGKKKNEAAEPVKVVETPKTLVGKGVIMVGDFEGNDPIVVNGTIKGSVRSTTTVTVNEDGLIKGFGKVEDFKVAGTIDGDFVCNNVASFAKTGIMTGTLTTNQLNTEPGTSFNGRLNLTLSKEIEAKKAEKEAKEKAEQEAKAKAEQEAKEKAEQEAKAKAEQEEAAKAEKASSENQNESEAAETQISIENL